MLLSLSMLIVESNVIGFILNKKAPFLRGAELPQTKETLWHLHHIVSRIFNQIFYLFTSLHTYNEVSDSFSYLRCWIFFDRILTISLILSGESTVIIFTFLPKYFLILISMTTLRARVSRVGIKTGSETTLLQSITITIGLCRSYLICAFGSPIKTCVSSPFFREGLCVSRKNLCLDSLHALTNSGHSGGHFCIP